MASMQHPAVSRPNRCSGPTLLLYALLAWPGWTAALAAPPPPPAPAETDIRPNAPANYEADAETAIPANILDTGQTATRTGALPFHLATETSLEMFAQRHDLAVALPEEDFLQSRFIQNGDLRASARPAAQLELHLVDKLYYVAEYGPGIDRDFVENDLRELYASWGRDSSLFFDAGRINLKNGVALGFNPTDYFKKNAVSLNISRDPGMIRENRIGTMLFKGQSLSETGTLTLVYAPRFSLDKDSTLAADDLFGLGLADLNASNRLLAKYGLNIWPLTKPELLFYTDEDQTGFGLNLSRSMGQRVVTYLEYSGGSRLDLFSEAAERLVANKTIASTDDFILPVQGRRFLHQLALGLSYTEDVNRTTHIEYHYNQAGLSRDEWDAWFDQGGQASRLRAEPAASGLAGSHLGQLWTVRSIGMEDPQSRHELFVRTAWQDSLMDNLHLTGLMKIDLVNGSAFVQPKAEYQWGNHWWLTVLANLNLGPSRSEYGSLPSAAGGQILLSYYF